MRIARKVVLLVVMATAAMVLAAPSAFAQDVELVQEHVTGTPHCPPVVPPGANGEPSGGCEIHATSEAGVNLELFGEPLTICLNDFEAYVDGDGHGWITHQTLTGAGCVAVPCPQGTGTEPWEIQVGEPASGVEHLNAHFCVEIGGIRTECTVEVEITPGAVQRHAYEYHANQALCAEDPFTHVTGHWTTEDHDVEIVH